MKRREFLKPCQFPQSRGGHVGVLQIERRKVLQFGQLLELFVPHVGARQILAKVPTPDNAVLLAVSPNQRAVEVVYGSDVKGRGIEESAPLGVSAAAELLKDGKLMEGLIKAVQVMSAGVSPR